MARISLPLSPIGFGAFKIGRSEGAKYPGAYELPDRTEAHRILNAMLDLGVNYIDTAPAYGVSEARIGESIAHRRNECFLSTKVGETFAEGRSRHDFSEHGIRNSIHLSLLKLHADELDIVYIHASHDDLNVVRDSDAVPTLLALRDAGLIRAVGLSGYTPEAFRAGMDWADAFMLSYHLEDCSLEPVMQEANQRGIMVVVKKGLASGHLPAADSVRHVLSHPAVTSMLVGTLSVDHMQQNVEIARSIRPWPEPNQPS